MTEYVRSKPAKDIKISEISEFNLRYRLVATIVSVNSTEIIINDGTGQFYLALGNYTPSNLKIGRFGRFIVMIKEKNEGSDGYLISYHEMTKAQIEQYKRIVKLEQSLSI